MERIVWVEPGRLTVPGNSRGTHTDRHRPAGWSQVRAPFDWDIGVARRGLGDVADARERQVGGRLSGREDPAAASGEPRPCLRARAVHHAARVGKTELYAAYVAYCDEHGPQNCGEVSPRGNTPGVGTELESRRGGCAHLEADQSLKATLPHCRWRKAPWAAIVARVFKRSRTWASMLWPSVVTRA
jgi:hypothetical protein